MPVQIKELPKWVNGVLCRTEEEVFEASTEDRERELAEQIEKEATETTEREAIESEELARTTYLQGLEDQLEKANAKIAKLEKKLKKEAPDVNSSSNSG